MKIGIDASPLSKKKTGVGNYVYPLLESLCKNNEDIEFFLYSNSEIIFPKLENVTFRISHLNLKGPFWQNSELLRMLLADSPDIYWATNGVLPFYVPSKISTVVTVHDFVYKFAPETMPWLSCLWRTLLQPITIKRADKIVTVSKATAIDMEILYNKKADKVINPVVSSIYSLVSGNKAINVFNKYKIPKNYILTLGTLEPRKNLATLLSAYLDCVNENINLPCLVIVGGKGWLDRKIHKLIVEGEERGIFKSMGFLESEDLPAIYQNSIAFIMPSIYEGFGIPIVEAQLSGIPVVHGSHPSMIEASGGLGISIAPSYEGIVNALVRISKGELNLNCRLITDINNDANLSSESLLAVMKSALNVSSR